MLLLARKRRRKTQTELAAESGVAQAAVSRIENGTNCALSLEQIQSIARVLRFPVSFFFEQEPVYHQPFSLHPPAFRKKAAVPVKDQDAVVALANHYVIQLRKLLDAVDLEHQFQLLQFEIVSEKSAVSDHAAAVTSATEAAQKIRASWHLDNGPLVGLVRFIEATGVNVLFGDFGGADIDGVTLRPASTRPVILLNRNRPADRIRFSLAHEYGHVVLHAYPYEAMEKEANEFAAELLLPQEGVLRDLKYPLSIPYLGKLKLKWHVAMSALIYRAKTLGTISNEKAISLYKQMSAYGYRTREPAEFNVPFEQTKLSSDLLQVHLHDLGYTVDELAEALKTLPSEFAEMYGLDAPPEVRQSRPKLQVVVNNG